MRKLFGKRNVAAPGDPAAVSADKTGEEHEHGTSLATSLGLSRAQLAHALTTYGYVAFWIVTSAGVILYNKWILTVWGFHFPITLTLWHMAFCSIVAFVLVRTGIVADVAMTRQMFLTSVVPIGLLFSGTLWFGNASYTYLSVSFIQMLKALMPAAVYFCSVIWGVEKKKRETMWIMVVISTGVCIASYGELAFVLTGVLFQLASIVTESNRIVLVQILLQSKGVKLNPITSMYYISPCCCFFLFFPWVALELPLLRAEAGERLWLDAHGYSVFLSNAAMAFTLNTAVFLLIGKSSALTMNIAGVVKDWLLIYLSWVLFAGPISFLNLFGYSIAFSAVCYYNYVKLKSMQGGESEKKDEAVVLPPPAPEEDEEGQGDAESGGGVPAKAVAAAAGGDGGKAAAAAAEASARAARMAALKAELAAMEAAEGRDE